jgi:hypothetical protein
MQRRIMTAAIAAAFAGAAAPAFALLPSAFNPATATQTYISGATAQENQLLGFMRRACNVGTLDKFNGPTNQAFYFCTANPTQVPGLAKANMVVYKSGVGGSGNGIDPVANHATLAFMDVATLSTSLHCTGSTAVPAVPPVAPDTIGLPAYTNWACAASPIVNTNTQLGFSDVEPNQFVNTGIASSASLSKLSINPINALTFGVPVTLGLRNALQTAQGLISGSEREDQMPSLSRTQITGIYTGSITTWDLLGLNNVTDNQIYIARRANSSGTQTSSRIFFLNDPCSPGMSSYVTNPANTNSANCSAAMGVAQTVFEGSGSGDVVNCLNGHDSQGRWAVGVLSVEFFSGTNGTTDNYRHVKVEGFAPTVYNVMQGRYPFWMEATMQFRNVAPNALAGDNLAFANAAAAKLADLPTVIGINTGFDHAFCHVANGGPGPGCAGILMPGLTAANNGLTPPSLPFTPSDADGTPINTATKSASGAPNNCQPPQPIFPTKAGATG